MPNKLLSITVDGKEGRKFSFNFYGDTKYLSEWREQGLQIDEVLNIIPEWVVHAGLARPWCFMQDVFNFKNPWGKD